MEETRKQPSPVMGSTKNTHRQPKYIDPMPRLVQVGDVAYAQNKTIHELLQHIIMADFVKILAR